MPSQAVALTRLLEILQREEGILGSLLVMADDMRDALVDSDFARLDATGQRMTESSEHLDKLEQEREQLVAAACAPGATLNEVVRVADDLGMPGFRSLRDRLAGIAADLQSAQERNARLVLSAARLRERWLGLMVGSARGTYGSRGRQALPGQPGFISKSA